MRKGTAFGLGRNWKNLLSNFHFTFYRRPPVSTDFGQLPEVLQPVSMPTHAGTLGGLALQKGVYARLANLSETELRPTMPRPMSISSVDRLDPVSGPRHDES